MIYFFYGEDTYSMEKAVTGLRKKFLASSPQGLNEALVWPADLTDEAALFQTQEVLASQGLFSPRRFVVLRDIVSRVNKFPRTEKFLEQFLGKEPRQDILVFVQHESTDRRLRFFKTLKAKTQAQEFVLPAGPALRTWVKKSLAEEDFQITAAGLEMLLARLGESSSLWEIENALQKLKLLRFSEKQIDTADVEKLVARAPVDDVFELTNAVGEGQTGLAMKILEDLLGAVSATDSKTEAIKIIGALAGQVRSLLLIKAVDGKPVPEMAKKLNWGEGRVWINQTLAHKFSQAKLLGLLRDLKAIDYRLKTSEEPAKLLLALFFQKAGADKLS